MSLKMFTWLLPCSSVPDHTLLPESSVQPGQKKISISHLFFANVAAVSQCHAGRGYGRVGNDWKDAQGGVARGRPGEIEVRHVGPDTPGNTTGRLRFLGMFVSCAGVRGVWVLHVDGGAVSSLIPFQRPSRLKSLIVDLKHTPQQFT